MAAVPLAGTVSSRPSAPESSSPPWRPAAAAACSSANTGAAAARGSRGRPAARLWGHGWRCSGAAESTSPAASQRSLLQQARAWLASTGRGAAGAVAAHMRVSMACSSGGTGGGLKPSNPFICCSACSWLPSAAAGGGGAGKHGAFRCACGHAVLRQHSRRAASKLWHSPQSPHPTLAGTNQRGHDSRQVGRAAARSRCPRGSGRRSRCWRGCRGCRGLLAGLRCGRLRRWLLARPCITTRRCG